MYLNQVWQRKLSNISTHIKALLMICEWKKYTAVNGVCNNQRNVLYATGRESLKHLPDTKGVACCKNHKLWAWQGWIWISHYGCIPRKVYSNALSFHDLIFESVTVWIIWDNAFAAPSRVWHIVYAQYLVLFHRPYILGGKDPCHE